jgi:hypothetical protein
MADQIQIPQRNPQYVEPVNPFPLVDSSLNRQQQAQQYMGTSAIGLGDTYNKLRQQELENYLRIQGTKAAAFGEGGPALYNMLYGNGQQSQQPSTQAQQPLPPTSVSDMSQGQSAGQTQPTQSPHGGQPAIDPMSPGGTIHTSLSMGHPDFAGYGQKIQDLTGQMTQSAGMYGPSKFGQANQQMLGGQLNALKTGMEAQTAPLTYQKTANEVAMQPTELAEKQQSLANAQQQIPMEVKKTVAGEVSKQSQDSQQIRDLQVLAGNLQKNMPTNLGLGGNIKGEVFRATGGRLGSAQAANMQNSMIPLATGLNTVLSHRFNAGEVQALASSLIPQPKDTPAYQQQKLQNLNNLLGVMAKGNEQNVENVKNAILQGTVPSIGIRQNQSSQGGPHGNTVVQNGHTYTWNGKNYE